MKISEFNELYKGKFRLFQLKSVSKNVRYALQEWCPGLDQWNHKLPKTNILIYRDATIVDDASRTVSKWVLDSLNTPSVIIDRGEYGSRVYSAMNTEEATLALLEILQGDRYSELLRYR